MLYHIVSQTMNVVLTTVTLAYADASPAADEAKKEVVTKTVEELEQEKLTAGVDFQSNDLFHQR